MSQTFKWVARGDPHVTVQEAVERLSGQCAEDLMFPTIIQPSTIENMPQAAALVREAIEKDEEITVYGDYDADGVCSMAILFLALTHLRVKAQSSRPIKVRAPKRMSEGYGLTAAAISEVESGLLIVVDNGISACDEIRQAKEKGLKVLVLDHHLPGEVIPPADVVVDLHIHPEKGFHDFCGAGLAYKLSELLIPDEEDPFLIKKLCALAAIATVADSVPMKDGNRDIVRTGLRAINAGIATQGLKSILRACGLTTVTEETIAFKIAPVLNAPGRLYDDGARYVSACLAQDLHPMDSMAQKLVATNDRRKDIVKEAVDIALANVVGNGKAPFVSILPQKYEGVAGIVAGKISEQYNTPAYVFSGDGEQLKGSGRSGPSTELNLFDVTASAAEYLERYGGHKGAVGLSVKRECLSDFYKCVHNACAKQGANDGSVIYYDIEISPDSVNACVREQSKYEPYGNGAKKPVFLIRNIGLYPQHDGEIPRYMGADKQHIKFRANGFVLVGFDMSQKYDEEGSPNVIDAVGTIGINDGPYGTVLQMQMLDFAAAERMKNN